jgi:hypothetical protein
LLSILCEDSTCAARTDVTIDISKANISTETLDNMIELTKDVTIEMKHLSYIDAQTELIRAEGQSELALVRATTIKCIEAVHTENERLEFATETPEMIEQFIDGMTSNQFLQLTTYANSLPTVELTTTWNCQECKKEQSMTLRGLQDFFQ